MSSGAKLTGGAHWLPVRARRVHDVHETAMSRTVYCPTTGSHVPLGDCEHCGHRIAIDRTERTTFLVCDGAPAGKVVDLPGTPPLGGDASDTPIRGIMASQVECVARTLPFHDLLALFIDYNLSGVPVVDSEGHPCGVVSKSDVVWTLQEAVDAERDELVVPYGRGTPPEATGELGKRLYQLTAGELMTPVVFSVPESASIARAAAIMAYEGVHRVPVVSEYNEVIGVVSSLDIARWVAAQAGYVLSSECGRR